MSMKKHLIWELHFAWEKLIWDLEKIGIEQNDLNCLEESWSTDPNALNVDKCTDP